jgi:hypothetical protein
VGLRVVRLEAQRLPELGDGLVEPAFVRQGVAEVVVGLGEILLESDGLPVLGDGEERGQAGQALLSTDKGA